MRSRERTGSRIATLLAGSWRTSPPPVDADVASLAPLLLRSGAAALASRRARLPVLVRAWQLQSLRVELHARAIARASSALRRAGIDAVLGKGFAVARLYPDPGLRPYGDIDLYVAPSNLARATAVLCEVDAAVDVHGGFDEIGDPAEVWARAQWIDVGGVPVRVLGAEDHLRLVALHLLRHGAWRPLWLCDLAVMVEKLAFEWDYLLGGGRRRAHLVACALELARELLGARFDRPRLPLPRWLPRAVLRQWADASFVPQGTRTPMAHVGPAWALLAALRQRWPNPIEATVGVGGRFDHLPRLPFQVVECARRVGAFSRQRI